MTLLQLGIVGTSLKEDERRMPIHPEHLPRLKEPIRRQLIFETGYGEPFGLTDNDIASQCGGIASRNELLADLDVVVLPKPKSQDLQELDKGGTLWGWPHCVQQRDITQTAIDRKLTLIAFEEMHVWGPDGHQGRHTFYKNNELAGYCAVLHALQIKGIDGHYGDQRNTIIFSFGAVSRGAIYALRAHGYRNITICILRPDHLVREEIPFCHYVQIRPGNVEDDEERMVVEEHDHTVRPLLELISEADIIVNGNFQDPNNPIHYILPDELSYLKPGCLIIDVSCDEGMGFPFAKPTSFRNPMFKIGSVDYYAVDHTPSYLWESATWCISAALLVHLPSVVEGRDSWFQNETIRRAIEIDEGVIRNQRILEFQQRNSQYPHLPMETGT